MFKDWDHHLNRLYKLLGSGTILINHVFEVSKQAGATIMLTKEDCSCPGISQDIRKRRGATLADRILILQENSPYFTLQPPDLPFIKQVTLWKNYTPLVPPYLHHIVCPKPSDVAIEEIAEQTLEKARKRQRRIQARRQPTATATHPGEAAA